MEVFDYIENNKYEVSALQRTLLISLMYEPNQNVTFFLKWLSSVDFDGLDYSSFRLVPVLFHVFQTIKEENPYYARMKGIYRYCLYKNSLLFSKGKAIFQKFIEANLEFILFKGAALTLKYYKNYSLRMMGDIDFLIHHKDVPQAEKILLEHDLVYRYEAERRAAFNEHSFDYIDANKNGYDLHWYSLYESLIPDIDQGIWLRAKFIVWEGLNIKVMAPEDLILTSCINGVRGCPIQCEWIYDVTKIIQMEPTISWDIVFQEAKNRNLNEKLFHTLYLIHSISEKAVPITVITQFLTTNKDYCRVLLHSLISEGRTHGLNLQAKRKMNKTLMQHLAHSFSFGKKSVSNTTSKYIRYFFDENHDINLLYLHYEYLHIVKEVFEVLNPKALDRILQSCPKAGEGYVKIAPGMLYTKTNPELPVYGASLEILTEYKNILFPGQKIKLKFKICNVYPSIFFTSSITDPHIKFGLSYHLLAIDGTCITWDNPRAYFIEPNKNYITFIGEQGLEVELEVQAPLETGTYIIQFDIAHERLTWYSQKGNTFPYITIQVL